MSRYSVDLAGKPWNPKGVDDVAADDHDIDRDARRQVQHTLGFDPAITGVAERPMPLPSLCLDPQRFAGVSRQEPLARHQRVGYERRQDDRRQAQTSEYNPARRRQSCSPTWVQDYQREKDHNEHKEHGGTGKHRPPQCRDRRCSRPGGIKRRQRSRARGQRHG